MQVNCEVVYHSPKNLSNHLCVQKEPKIQPFLPISASFCGFSRLYSPKQESFHQKIRLFLKKERKKQDFELHIPIVFDKIGFTRVAWKERENYYYERL